MEQSALGTLELPIKLGKLKYNKCPKDHWHASLAKNTAHMAACLDVGGGLTPSAEDDALLVNLDGDSVFTSEWSVPLLKEDGPRLVKEEATVVPATAPTASAPTAGCLA